MRGFLRSGEFGPVRLGDSVDKLRSSFGDFYLSTDFWWDHLIEGIY
jgi:hypothetical protein